MKRKRLVNITIYDVPAELVEESLGHKCLDTTTLCIQLEKSLFKTDSDKFTVEATSHPEEMQTLLEAGFEFCQKTA